MKTHRKLTETEATAIYDEVFPEDQEKYHEPGYLPFVMGKIHTMTPVAAARFLTDPGQYWILDTIDCPDYYEGGDCPVCGGSTQLRAVIVATSMKRLVHYAMRQPPVECVCEGVGRDYDLKPCPACKVPELRVRLRQVLNDRTTDKDSVFVFFNGEEQIIVAGTVAVGIGCPADNFGFGRRQGAGGLWVWRGKYKPADSASDSFEMVGRWMRPTKREWAFLMHGLDPITGIPMKTWICRV